MVERIILAVPNQVTLMFKKVILFSFFILSATLSASNPVIDSCFKIIKETEDEYKKIQRLENHLQFYIRKGYSDEEVMEGVSKIRLSPQMILMVNSYEIREYIYRGDWESAKAVDGGLNPYIYFQKGNALYFSGNRNEAIRAWQQSFRLSSSSIDSSLCSSVLNNIGATHWALTNLDSALIYFQIAKGYTTWFNEMLEANTLAIANSLKRYDISKQTIVDILEEKPDINNGVFWTNVHYYYESAHPEQLDSLEGFLFEKFDQPSKLEDPLVPLFVEKKIFKDSILFRIAQMGPTVHLERALNRLSSSDLITSNKVQDSTLIRLAASIEDIDTKTKIALFVGKDSIEKFNLVKLFQGIENQDEETLDNLQAAADQYKYDVEKLEEENKNIIIIGLLSLIIVLAVVIFQQRRLIDKRTKVLAATQRSHELQNANSMLAEEMKGLKRTIHSITQENLKQSKGLLEWAKQFNAAKNETTVSELDINTIITYQNGLLRFKVLDFCNHMNSSGFDKLDPILSEIETQILKLTVLGFRSKEIATLLDLTPQYINNVRSKTRTKMDETGYDYDKTLENLRINLNH